MYLDLETVATAHAAVFVGMKRGGLVEENCEQLKHEVLAPWCGVWSRVFVEGTMEVVSGSCLLIEQ